MKFCLIQKFMCQNFEVVPPSVAAGDQFPALVGGTSLLPQSHSKNTYSYIDVVGIPASKIVRTITNLNENR
jgi:hypothetical protein